MKRIVGLPGEAVSERNGVVYIDGWAPGKRIKGTDQFSYRPVYRLHREPGRRADAPRPDKLTVTEKNRRYLQKKREVAARRTSAFDVKVEE